MNGEDVALVKEAAAERLDTDLVRLTSLISALDEMSVEMMGLEKKFRFAEKGYFSNIEHDQIEELLFRYLSCRETIWEMINYHKDYDKHFAAEDHRVKSFTIGFAAASHLYYYGSLVVHTWLDYPNVVKKLNESYHRSEIPADTFETVFKSLTDPYQIKAIRAAWKIYSDELVRTDSALSILARSVPEYGRLIASTRSVYEKADKNVVDILNRKSLFLPVVRNILRHTEINNLAELSTKKAGSALYAIRGLTFTKISRLKAPLTQPFVFQPEQIKNIRSLLRPGDVILTYTEGYMSNLFLPGSFKHGIVYVGSPDGRKDIERAGAVEKKTSAQQEKIRKNIKIDRLRNGSEADLVEGLAEGVIFNSLDHLLTSRINRLVVWRPRLTREQRAAYLSEVFLFLGNPYDFKFDFNDATYICCTELIYRCLNRQGPISFELVERMGRHTLSADDICNYALKEGNGSFDLVALAEPEKNGPKNQASLYEKNKGLNRLKEIMGK